jgi:hypothetical protein
MADLLRSYFHAVAIPAFPSTGAAATTPIVPNEKIVQCISVSVRTMVASALRVVMPYMLSFWQRLKVRRIATGLGDAAALVHVMQVESIGDRSDGQLVSHAVSLLEDAADSEVPITACVSCADERPTGIVTARPINFGPESFLNRGTASQFARATMRTNAPPTCPYLAGIGLEWASAHFARSGNLGAHCRDSFGDVAPPADSTRRGGIFVPKLYPVGAS